MSLLSVRVAAGSGTLPRNHGSGPVDRILSKIARALLLIGNPVAGARAAALFQMSFILPAGPTCHFFTFNFISGPFDCWPFSDDPFWRCHTIIVSSATLSAPCDPGEFFLSGNTALHLTPARFRSGGRSFERAHRYAAARTGRWRTVHFWAGIATSKHSRMGFRWES